VAGKRADWALTQIQLTQAHHVTEAAVSNGGQARTVGQVQLADRWVASQGLARENSQLPRFCRENDSEFCTIMNKISKTCYKKMNFLPLWIKLVKHVIKS
jgi:hypothetical protein